MGRYPPQAQGSLQSGFSMVVVTVALRALDTYPAGCGGKGALPALVLRSETVDDVAGNRKSCECLESLWFQELSGGDANLSSHLLK